MQTSRIPRSSDRGWSEAVHKRFDFAHRPERSRRTCRPRCISGENTRPL